MKNETKQMIIEEYALREMAEYCEGLMVALQHPEEHIPESNEVIAAAIKSAERINHLFCFILHYLILSLLGTKDLFFAILFQTAC